MKNSYKENEKREHHHHDVKEGSHQQQEIVLYRHRKRSVQMMISLGNYIYSAIESTISISAGDFGIFVRNNHY